ncbi:LysR family transcriptional regulator [Acidisphaera sp. S103]|uniref:LysR family transcriptional regulator n=1 Tax=Acidisphaera sp. S103 TaxID=1747223 RepID=UPI00131C1BA2|nr:LysR substrate-binding domain-containing protein [Acidisphaera sp. S103]
MDARDLRYFIAAAETGHLHQAAERIGRSQPALSKCIRRLETEIGARLFQPVGRGLKLTQVGHALLVRARGIVLEMQDTLREITDIARGDAGHVRLGSGPTTAEWLLPELFRRLLIEAPGLTFQVTTGLGDVLRQGLREGRLDLAITPLVDGDAAEFESFPIAEDMMVVAARIGHPLDRPGLRPADLARFSWLLPAASLASTAWLLRTLQSTGVPTPRIQVEADTVIMLRRVVSQTDLLTFLSRRDLAHGEGVALRELDLSGIVLRRRVGSLSVRNGYLSPAINRVMALLRDRTYMLEAGVQDLQTSHRTAAEPERLI